MTTETKTYEPLPENEYAVRLGRFEEKATKNGKGKMLSAAFEVFSGDFKNRLVFHNFLIEHTSPKAQKIGREQLSKYLNAVGVEGGLAGIDMDLTKLEDFQKIPVAVKVVIEEPQEYTDSSGVTRISKARNKITSFKAL